MNQHFLKQKTLVAGLLLCCFYSQVNGQTWGPEQFLTAWFQDPGTPYGSGAVWVWNNQTNDPRPQDYNATMLASAPLKLTAGPGVSISYNATISGTTVHTVNGVNFCSPADAEANNDYIKGTLVLRSPSAAMRTLRIDKLSFQTVTDQSASYSFHNYNLSLAVKDITTNGPLVYAFKNLNVTSPGGLPNNQIALTGYTVTAATSGVNWNYVTLIPGHTYEVRWYFNRRANECSINNNKGIDNPIIYVQMEATTTISGTVYNDADGSGNGINNLSGVEISGLNAVLVNANGKVAAVSPVSASNGTYSFSNINPDSASFRVLLTTGMPTVGQPAPAAADLPAGWISTGENNGTGTGNDGIADGISAPFTATATVTNINFGIRRQLRAAATLIKEATPGTAIPFDFTTTGGSTALADTATDITPFDLSFTADGKLLITTYNGRVYTLANTTSTFAEPDPVDGHIQWIDGGADAGKFIGYSSYGNVQTTSNGGATYTDRSGLRVIAAANIDSTRFFVTNPDDQLYYYDGAAYHPKAYGAKAIDYFNGTLAMISEDTSNVPGFKIAISKNTSLSSNNDGTRTWISPLSSSSDFPIDIVIGPGISPNNPNLGLIYIATATGDVQYYTGTGNTAASWITLPAPPAPAIFITTDPSGTPWIRMDNDLIAVWTGGPADTNGTWRVLQVRSSGASNFVNYFGLPAGQFNITENAPSGNYILSSIRHEGSGTAVTNVTTRTDSLTLAYNDHAFETFSNENQFFEPASVTLIKEAAPDTGTPFDFTTTGGSATLADTAYDISAKDISFTADGKLLITTNSGRVYTLANTSSTFAEPNPTEEILIFVDGGPDANRFVGMFNSLTPTINVTNDGGATYTSRSRAFSVAAIDSTRFFATVRYSTGYRVAYYDGTTLYPKAYGGLRMDYYNNTVAVTTTSKSVGISQNTTLSSAEDGTLTIISPNNFVQDIVVGPGASPDNPGLSLIYIVTTSGEIRYYTGTGNTVTSWIALPAPPVTPMTVTTDPGGTPWITMSDGRVAVWTGGPANATGAWKVLQLRSSGPGNFVNYFGLHPGAFTIRENIPSGNYILQGIQHEGSGTAYTDIATRTDSLILAGKDHAFETFTNQVLPAQGSIISGSAFLNIPGKDIVLFPNPARDLLTIESGNQALQQISVYNAVGQLVYSAPATGASRHQLTTASYTPGIYLVRIQTDKGEVTSRFEIRK